MRLTEPYLIEGRCFLCCVVEVRHVMTVIGIDTSYAPTGRGWIGRRNTRGGVAFWAHVGGFLAGIVLIKALPERPQRYRYGTW